MDAGEAADPGLFACPPDGGRDPGGSRPGGLRSWRPPAPGDARPGLSDDAVNLLYRSLLGSQRFSAEIHERVDNEEMLRLAGTTFASTSLGRRTRWLWHPPEDYAPENVDQAARLQVAMPGRYRIDARTDPGTRPTCITCDAEHMWRVYPDRVAVRPAEPPPTGIALIIDPAVFRIEPPLGTPVITGGLLAEADLTPAGAAVMLARGASRLAFDLSRRWHRH